MFHLNPRSRNPRSHGILQRPDQARRLFLVIHLHNDLRVIGLLEFRRNRKPEPRPASADESCQRMQNLTRFAVFSRMFLPILQRGLLKSMFSFERRLAGEGNG